MGDVIDFKSRRLKSNNEQIHSTDYIEKDIENNNPKVDIFNISEIRNQIIKDERRDKKRTILNGFIGAHVVVPGQGLLKVALFDISEAGLSFDLDPDWGFFKEKEEVALRFYFNHQTYFPFEIKVTSSRLISEEGIIRHGATLIPDADKNETFFYFTYFLESISKNLKVDNGDIAFTDRKV